jgi:hypothetical protein
VFINVKDIAIDGACTVHSASPEEKEEHGVPSVKSDFDARFLDLTTHSEELYLLGDQVRVAFESAVLVECVAFELGGNPACCFTHDGFEGIEVLRDILVHLCGTLEPHL